MRRSRIQYHFFMFAISYFRNILDCFHRNLQLHQDNIRLIDRLFRFCQVGR